MIRKYFIIIFIGLESEITGLIEQIYTNCSRLEEFVFKQPPQRKQSSKL